MATQIDLAPRHPLETGFRASHVGQLFANIWRYHQLLAHLVVRSLKGQYKESFVGYAWIFVNPLTQFAVYSFVFSSILRVPSEGGQPFVLVLFVGLLPWIFFSNAVASATDSIVGAGSLVKVVYFPRELLVVAAVLTRVVDWLAGLIILLALLLYTGHSVTLSAAWLPMMFFVYSLFTLGICLPLAALNLFFRDVRYLVGIGLMLWFFITPIVYPISVVPHKYLWVYDININSRFVNSFRYALLQGGSPPLASLGLALLLSFLILTAGYFLFKSMESSFADRI